MLRQFGKAKNMSFWFFSNTHRMKIMSLKTGKHRNAN